MAGEDLGRLLEAAGWQQGVLLQVQDSAVLFHLDDPITRVARQARPVLETEYRAREALGNAPPSRRVIGIGAPKKTSERLVIITQTCDIVKKQTVEPVVWAIRAFFTNNTEVLALAGGNSKRQFLLDEDRGLVAEMSHIMAIEKPALLELIPEVGVPDDATRRRFASWLADRFSRVPHEEPIVHAVISPILDNLHKLQATRDPDLAALRDVREVRFVRLQGNPPYDVRLLFMVKGADLPDGGVALDRLVGRIRQWLEERGEATLTHWDTATPADLALEEYLNTEKLDLDEYTYRGRTVQGLAPIPRL